MSNDHKIKAILICYYEGMLPNFNILFIQGLREWRESGKDLTKNQNDALEKIFNSYKIAEKLGYE